MMKRLILVLLIAVTSNLANAAESGPYLGAHIGFGHGKFKSENLLGEDETIDGFGADGIMGGGFVGYQFGFEKAAFSVEFDYSLAGVDAKISGEAGSLSVGLDSLMSFTGKLAYSVVDRAAVFARGGYAIGDFSGKVSGGLEQLLEGGDDKDGAFVLGLGMEIDITENSSFYGEYQYQRFGSGDLGKGVYNDAFRAGFRYQF